MIIAATLAIGLKGANTNEYTRVINKEFNVNPDATAHGFQQIRQDPLHELG